MVVYEYTPDGFNGTRLKPIIETIIKKAESVGLRVHSITSDMGSTNQVIWRAFNIGLHRHSTIRNSVSHPMDNTRKLYFFADSPHLLKNLRTAIINNKLIALPDKFVQTHKLLSCVVKFSHLEELVQE